MSFAAPIKDPDAFLDYQIDWSDWLASGETISTSSWSAEAGITVSTDSKTTTTTTVWLDGGTAGHRYTVVNHITTSAGRQDDRSIEVKVQDR